MLLTLLYIAAAILIAWCLFWVIDQPGFPGPVAMILKGVVAIGAILYILQQVGINLPGVHF